MSQSIISQLDNVIVFIPSLNPDEKLLSTIGEIKSRGFETIVILDDGSREDTKAYFDQAMERYGCVILHHYINLGKGRALKTAFNYILQTYPDCKGVVTADADGQHKAEDVVRCAREMLAHPEALVIGSRNFGEKAVPFRSKFGNILTRNVFNVLCGVRVEDTQTGLRALSRECMTAFLPTKGERFEYEMNMLIDTKEKGIPIREVPIETVYIEENKTSHFNPVWDSLRVYSVFARFLFSSLSSFLLDILLFALFAACFEESRYFIVWSTVAARIISSLYNFAVNKNHVFRVKDRRMRVVVRYYCLCLVEMALTALGVQVLYDWLKINEVAIKIVVDLLLFLVSFCVQKEWVFRDKGDKA